MMLGIMWSLGFLWLLVPPCFHGVWLSLVGLWEMNSIMLKKLFVGPLTISSKPLLFRTLFLFRSVWNNIILLWKYEQGWFWFRVILQVGDANKDHACWERPEDMDTPRTVLKIDRNSPGSDVAAETAAALASASIVFRTSDPSYSKLLIKRAIRVKKTNNFDPQTRFKIFYGKPERESLKRIISVSGELDSYKWYQSQTSGDVLARRLSLEGGRH